MLAPAYYHREALNEARAKTITDANYQYLGVNSYLNYEIPLDTNSKDKEQWVSLDSEGKIAGYLAAKIDREARNVVELTIIRFGNEKTFNYDLFRFIKSLKQYRVITWACVKGNPAESHYDNLAKIFGGRIVGEFTKNTRLADGKLYNVKWYEVVNPRYNEEYE